MQKQEGELIDRDLVISLKSQLASLQTRVKELEAENAKLSSQCSASSRGKSEEKLGSPNLREKKEKERIPANLHASVAYDSRIMSQHPKRYVALKVMYFGSRFYGFASEAQMEPTVESEIFKALEKTRLLFGDRKESQYSRCGRTDKGVSSVGQVISLFLRSNLEGVDANSHARVELVPELQNEEEIDYVRVLNRVLPKDIRILGWSPVSTDFSARFSCLARVYKYYFWRGNMNVLAMESAGKKFVGEHDFRNFCKMDAANVHNYRRCIASFEIAACDMRHGDNQLYVIKIKGSAFLWHQVRCMVAVLFMIGQGLESSDVIDALLDTQRTPRKPQYPIAPGIPLVLQDCEFENVKFICSPDAGKALRLHLENECLAYQLQSAVYHEAVLSCVPLATAQSLNDATVRKAASHVPLLSRPTEPSYEERRTKVKPKMKLRIHINGT